MHEEGRGGSAPYSGPGGVRGAFSQGICGQGVGGGGREVERRNGITFIFESSVRFIG